jgi:hypothetical protein
MRWTIAPTPRQVRIARSVTTVLRTEERDPLPAPRGRDGADPATEPAAGRAADGPADPSAERAPARPFADDDAADRAVLRLRHADRA